MCVAMVAYRYLPNKPATILKSILQNKIFVMYVLL